MRVVNCFLIAIIALLSCSSKAYNPYKVEILPIQCFNNIYLDNLLDSLREEESCNGKYTIKYNYRNGKLDSIDEGDYQHNSKNRIYFANKYNDGKRYNPYDKDIARRISRQYLIDNYKLSKNWFDALVIYNCGPGRWAKGAPYKSYKFAERIMRRIK